MQALNGHPKPTNLVSDAHRLRSQQVRTAVNQTLYEATQLKALTFNTAMAMNEEFKSEAKADLARARAQAITGLVKSWGEAVNVIRIERGKPLPGSLRPESKPKKPKRTKPQQTLFDQDQPACGPNHTAGSVPHSESLAPKPQESGNP